MQGAGERCVSCVSSTGHAIRSSIDFPPYHNSQHFEELLQAPRHFWFLVLPAAIARKRTDCLAAAISVRRLKPSQLMDKWSKCLWLRLLRPPVVSAFNKQIAQTEAIVELTQMELLAQTQIQC